MLFDFKKKLQSFYAHFSEKISSLFSRPSIDKAALEELSALLLQADVGPSTTKKIIQGIEHNVTQGIISDGNALQELLKKELINLISRTCDIQNLEIIFLVGINGSGKTTSAAKLAYYYKSLGKKVVLAAADTFRAAAQEQLSVWADRLEIPVIKGLQAQDPGSVIYAACQYYKQNSCDVLIVDTAGRLQTKSNLMNELAALKRIIVKQLPHKKIATFLTIDATLGQNSLDQAFLFHESTQLDGIILTKTDGSSKGGIIFAIADRLSIPVVFLTYGEQMQDIAYFNPISFVDILFSK